MQVREILSNKCVDGFGLSETKIDESFPTAQFNVPDFKLYPEDRDAHGGGVARYVRSTLPHRQRSDIAVNEYPEYYSRSNSENGRNGSLLPCTNLKLSAMLNFMNHLNIHVKEAYKKERC